MGILFIPESGGSMVLGEDPVPPDPPYSSDFWCPEGTAAAPMDDEQRSLWKWCQRLYLTIGNVTEGCPFPEGTQPLPSDNEERLYQKINRMLQGPRLPTYYSYDYPVESTIIPGDPPDLHGVSYDLSVTSATSASGIVLHWTYPTAELINPTIGNKIYLQRSSHFDNHPLGGTNWSSILVLPGDTGPPSDNDWVTIQSWVVTATGWTDPALPTGYVDTYAVDKLYNYRLVMFVGGGPGGTYEQIDWNVTTVATQFTFYVGDQSGNVNDSASPRYLHWHAPTLP